MVTDEQLDAAAAMFKALSDPLRLKTLLLLADREHSVTEIRDIEDEKMGTVSARLKVLLAARLVQRRKDGQNAFYSLADSHVLALVDNAIEHACEHH